MSLADLTGMSLADLTGMSLADLTGMSLADLTGMSLADLTGMSLADLTGIPKNSASAVLTPAEYTIPFLDFKPLCSQKSLKACCTVGSR
jgi:hypothetical protein